MGKERQKRKELRQLLSPLTRFWRHDGRRYCAIALCASLIAGNIGHLAAAASEDPDYKFELDRVALYEALQQAVADGNTVDGDFEFAGLEADTYEISMAADGSLYELSPEIEDNKGKLNLRVFARLGEDIDLVDDVSEGIGNETSSYEIDGSEEFYFLLTNTSDQEQTAVIRVGEKETDLISVVPYSDVEVSEPEGKAAVNALSDGVQAGAAGTQEVGPGVTNTEGIGEISTGTVTAGGSGSSGGGSGSGSGGSSGGSTVKNDTAVDVEISTEAATQPEIETETEVKVEETEAVVPETEVNVPETEIPETEVNVSETEVGSTETDKSEAPVESEDSTEIKNETPKTDADVTIDMEGVGTEITEETDVSVVEDEKSEDAAVDEKDSSNDGGSTNDAAGTSNEDAVSGAADDREAASVDVAGISLHKTYRVASSKATPSDATPSDATPSDASESDMALETLDGTVLNAVRMGDASAVVFMTTADELKVSNDLEKFASPSNAGHLYEASLDTGLVVQVYANEGAFEEDVELSVKELKEDDEETAEDYQAAKDALDAENTEYTGMIALDISFLNDAGDEVEPKNGSVQVCIEMDKAVLPDDVIEETLAVKHLEEDKHGNVESINTVADNADVEVDTEKAVVSASFEVKNFSTFTITWSNTSNSPFTVNVKYVDVNGEEITYTNASNVTVDGMVSLSTYAYAIDGYEYKGAYLNSVNGTPITDIKPYNDNYFDYLLYKNDETNWRYLRNESTVLLVYSGSTPSTPSVENVQKLAKEKYAMRRDDGTYDLTLTIAGEVGSVTQKALLDVIYVLDTSGSMKYSLTSDSGSNNERRNSAGQAIDSLTNSLANNTKLDTRFALVTFSGNDGWGESNWDDSEIIQGWTYNASDITSKSKPTPDGGTNYQAGLVDAKTLLKTKRSGAITAVVFVSDGDPTFYYGSNGKTQGNGSNDDNNNSCLKAAITEVATMSVDYFFTVGVGLNSNYQKLRQLKDAANNVSVSNRKFYEGTDQTNLNAAFNSIEASITHLLCTNVTVMDTLSDNVYVVTNGAGNPEELLITVTTVNDSSKTVTVASGYGSVVVDGNIITASYDVNTKQLVLDFPDSYELKQGYTYQVTAHINATETAYSTYRNGNLEYKDTPDVGTGTHGLSEDSVEKGFYSNKQATVLYSYNGEENKESYLDPVVQLNPGTLVIKKKISGLYDTDLNSLKESLQFKINLKWNDEKGGACTEIKTVSLKDMEEDQTTGEYVYTLKGLSPNTSFEVSEINEEVLGYNIVTTQNSKVDGDVVTDSSQFIPKGKTATVQFTNTYEKLTSLTIEKQVTGNMADTNKAFSFEVSLPSGSLPSSATITNGGSDYSVADDKATFSLADGQSITINGIPIDVEATITEVGCDGYKVSATKNGSSIVVSNDIVNNKQTATMQVKTVTDGLKVVVVNDNTDIVDTGVLLDSMPYVLILAAAIAGAAFYFIRKKKDDEDDLD